MAVFIVTDVDVSIVTKAAGDRCCAYNCHAQNKR